MTDSLYSMMIELDEFIDAIPEEMIEDKEIVSEFDAIMERIENKTDNCANYLDFCKGRLEELAIKKKRVDEAIKSYNSKIKRMNTYLIACAKLNNNELLGQQYKLKIRKNPPSVVANYTAQKRSYEAINPELLPFDLQPFVKETKVFTINKQQLKNCLKDDEMHFDNAWLHQSERIVIREK